MILPKIIILKPGGLQYEVTTEAKQGWSSIEEAVDESLGRGHQIEQPSVRLHDYIIHTVQTLSPSILTSTPRHPSSTAYPIAHLNCD